MKTQKKFEKFCKVQTHCLVQLGKKNVTPGDNVHLLVTVIEPVLKKEDSK